MALAKKIFDKAENTLFFYSTVLSTDAVYLKVCSLFPAPSGSNRNEQAPSRRYESPLETLVHHWRLYKPLFGCGGEVPQNIEFHSIHKHKWIKESIPVLIVQFHDDITQRFGVKKCSMTSVSNDGFQRIEGPVVEGSEPWSGTGDIREEEIQFQAASCCLL